MIRFVTNGTIGVSPDASIYAVLPIRLSVQVTSLSRSQAAACRELLRTTNYFALRKMIRLFPALHLNFTDILLYLIEKKSEYCFHVFHI